MCIFEEGSGGNSVVTPLASLRHDLRYCTIPQDLVLTQDLLPRYRCDQDQVPCNWILPQANLGKRDLCSLQHQPSSNSRRQDLKLQVDRRVRKEKNLPRSVEVHQVAVVVKVAPVRRAEILVTRPRSAPKRSRATHRWTIGSNQMLGHVTV